MIILRVAAIAALSLGVLGGLKLRHAPPDLSSPKATVRSFVAGINAGDGEKAAGCVKTSQPNDGLQDFKYLPNLNFQISDIAEETEGNNSRVAVEFSSTRSEKPATEADFLTLEKIGDEWKIVPNLKLIEEIPIQKDGDATLQHPLSLFAVVFASTEATRAMLSVIKVRTQANTSLSNSHKIATAMMMYVQDFDETMPYPSKNYASLVSPYVKDRTIFHAPAAPADEKVSYTFNKNLQGLSLAEFDKPEKTVMLYEGRGAKPEYRYEGKTVIAFVDGHCRTMTPAEVAKLNWGNKDWKPFYAEVPKPRALTKKKNGSRTKTKKRG